MSNAKTRPMDDPDISGVQFLYRVMREKTLDLAVRMEAADKLLQLGFGNYKEEEVHITIRTCSPRLEDLSPEAQLNHLRGRRRYELVDPYVAYWDEKGVKGHA